MPGEAKWKNSFSAKIWHFQKTLHRTVQRCGARCAFEVAGSGRGERDAPATEVMNRRGVEFTLVRVEPGVWQWRFQIGETVSTGKTQTSLMGLAARRVQQRIDFELRKPRDFG
jgi:hypothetical protein